MCVCVCLEDVPLVWSSVCRPVLVYKYNHITTDGVDLLSDHFGA